MKAPVELLQGALYWCHNSLKPTSSNGFHFLLCLPPKSSLLGVVCTPKSGIFAPKSHFLTRKACHCCLIKTSHFSQLFFLAAFLRIKGFFKRQALLELWFLVCTRTHSVCWPQYFSVFVWKSTDGTVICQSKSDFLVTFLATVLSSTM